LLVNVGNGDCDCFFELDGQASVVGV
jgi:hypothetical protein